MRNTPTSGSEVFMNVYSHSRLSLFVIIPSCFARSFSPSTVFRFSFRSCSVSNVCYQPSLFTSRPPRLPGAQPGLSLFPFGRIAEETRESARGPPTARRAQKLGEEHLPLRFCPFSVVRLPRLVVARLIFIRYRDPRLLLDETRNR